MSTAIELARVRRPAPTLNVFARAEAARVAGRGPTLRGPTLFGLGLLAVFFGGFGSWATLVPIPGGAIAPGIISPEGSRRVVQHLEGGIVARLHVREGDSVAAGQPLVELESLQARAGYDVLLNQRRALGATLARLQAEQSGAKTLTFPPELRADDGDPAELRTVLDGQTRLFETRRDTHAARKRVIRQRIEGLHEQIRGAKAQIESAQAQIALIGDELEGKRTLFAKQMLTKPDIRKLERAQAELTGRRGELQANVARLHEAIGEAELQALALDAERADEVAARLHEVRTELGGVREKIAASRDVLRRTVLTAPVAGSVVNLRARTLGGVVKPGDALLDLAPAEETLRIDARVAPNDIDVVHAGLEAHVHLSAFSSRLLPRIGGRVVAVSADRLVDERTGQGYFLAQVEVDRDALRRIDPTLALVAGMPAEVLIVTGERTVVRYLFQPLIDAVRRSLREA